MKSKAQRWRIGLICGLIIAFGIIYSGCSKKDDTNNDEYYVKYEVNSSTIYYQEKLNVTLRNEKDSNTTISINIPSKWETVIGPVKKSFNATMAVIKEGAADSQLKLNTQISVSKNNGPFALKQIDNSDAPRNSAQINYTIDY